MFLKFFMPTQSHFIQKAISQLFHSLFPPLCIFCGYPSQRKRNTCLPCQEGLPILSQYCFQCAQILPKSAPAMRCGHCLNHPPPFSFTYALFPYESPVVNLITGLKFKHQLSNALTLGELLAEKIEKEWYLHKPFPDRVIPVPLHPKRLQERGFNQAIEIARCLTHLLPIDVHGVKRVKNTKAQSGLPAAERACNVAGAFAVNENYKGLRVAILDDVITTGHTVLELSRVLKQHGAAQIDVWCCARRV